MNNQCFSPSLLRGSRLALLGNEAAEVSLKPAIAMCLMLDISTVPDAALPDLIGSMSNQEKNMFASIRPDEARRARVATRAALRRVLSGLTGLSPMQVPLEVGPYGKLFVANFSSLHFNVSHSGHFCLLAFSQDGDIGCDIEQAGRIESIETLADVVLHPKEAQVILALQGAAAEDAFLRCWVRKEAVLKALGVGFTVDPKSVNVGLSGSVIQLDQIAGVAPVLTATPFNLHCTSPAEGYFAAVASRSSSCHWSELLL